MSSVQEMVFSTFSFASSTHRNAVPVIAIFTKFDDLITQVYERGLKMTKNRQAALQELETKFQTPLRKFKFPPSAYVRLEGMFNVFFTSTSCPLTRLTTEMQKDDGKHQDQVKALIKATADSLNNLALKMLFVSVQQNNLELCMKYAVDQYELSM
jgi:hypothetical protein